MSLFAPLFEISLPKVESEQEVLELVREHLLPILPARAPLISIDGLDGSGKSTIGRSIAALSGRSLIDLDEFLQKQQGQFLGALRFDDLRRALADEPTVIEGCLVGAVLRRLTHEADFQIYVARTGRMRGDTRHEWCDEHELLFGTRTAAELIKEEEDQLKAFSETGFFGMNSDDGELPALWKELITYHREFAPHRTADLIVKVERSV